MPKLQEVRVGTFEEWGAEADHCLVTAIHGPRWPQDRERYRRYAIADERDLRVAVERLDALAIG